MVFSLGCLKKTLLALVALSLLISIGQLVLIFICNKVFGVVMFVIYILFFLAILLALCRDSISMYAASFVLLIVFVISCALIQSYKVHVRDLMKLGEDEKASTTPAPGAAGTGTGGTGTGTGSRRRRRGFYLDMNDDAQWKMQSPPPTWEPPEGLMPVLPSDTAESDNAERMESRQRDNNFDIEPAPPLPAQPTDQPTELTEMPTLYPPGNIEDMEPVTQLPYYPHGPKKDAGAVVEPDDEFVEKKAKPEAKTYDWNNELRWVSNVLGVLHILMISSIVCLLYEMLFGGRYRYRTWC